MLDENIKNSYAIEANRENYVFINIIKFSLH